MTMKSIAVIFQTTLILIFLSEVMYNETEKYNLSFLYKKTGFELEA